MSREVITTHFSLKDLSTQSDKAGVSTGAVAGVEAVMQTQERILGDRGWNVETVVGDGDPREGLVIYEPIRSGYWPVDMDEDDQSAAVCQMMTELPDLLADRPVIAHNTTNAARHNLPFGKAMATLAEHRIDQGSPHIILWSHDARNASVDDLNRFLPHRESARIVCVSRTREEELQARLDEVRRVYGDIALPQDIRVIYNPINPMYMAREFPAPGDLRDLAPNIEHFTARHGLHQNLDDVEEALLDPDGDTMRFIVPARIVAQKGIVQAFDAANVFADTRGQKTALIITGPPDERKPENIKYWHEVRDRLNNGHSPYLQVCMLGGVATEYMPWLFHTPDHVSKTSKVMLLPSVNEGFGLPPSEAACMGTPSIITDIGAFKETTRGNALMIPVEQWQDPVASAEAIDRYLSSNQPNQDVEELSEIAHNTYSPKVIGDQLEAVLE